MKEFHRLYASPNILRMSTSRMKCGGSRACMSMMINACTILYRSPEGKILLGRHRLRQMRDEYYMDLLRYTWDLSVWIGLIWPRTW
jgi:hypothetical protein